jgi:oligopeptide transport system ATP-binding protein
MNGDVILQVKDLHKYYPMREGFLLRNRRFVHAVDGVDLEIHRGEMLGLVGESGCGKSTLGRLVLGLEQPTSGKIFFEGEMIHEYNKSQFRRLRREMQIIFQDPYSSLNPRKTVGSIINEPFVVHHLGDHDEQLRWVVKLLEVVGLRSEHYSRYPHEFSGGQRQRINIARALALNPKLIVADEPVSSLDVSIQAQVINLMKDLQDLYHLTYLFISHDLGLIRHISNRVGVMYLGKIVEIADSRSLFQNPQHPYTEALLSLIPQISQAKKKKRILLKGEVPSPINPPSGCRFRTRCPHAAEVCTDILPVLKEVGPSHLVACHLSRS